MDLLVEARRLHEEATALCDYDAALFYWQMLDSLEGHVSEVPRVVTQYHQVPDDRHECRECGWRWGCMVAGGCGETVCSGCRRLM